MQYNYISLIGISFITIFYIWNQESHEKQLFANGINVAT